MCWHMTEMRKKLNIYSTKTIVCNMQRRHVALGNNPPTPPTYKSIFTEDPSPQRPPTPTRIRSYTQIITKHDYVTKPVSLGEK